MKISASCIMRLFTCGVLFTLLLGIATHIQAELVGSIDGRFAVENGVAAYSIPILVPPGTAGMQPELSLAYTSQTGNGLLGIGWSIGGLSMIHRCPQTEAQDGKFRPVTYGVEDRYCLDGQRLIAVVGGDGGDGTEYRTEIDGFSRIVSHGNQGNGPEHWTIQTKSGQVFEYGVTADSRIEMVGQQTVRLWSSNSIQDTVGNNIDISYTDGAENGDFYPSQITYAGNNVQFEYEARSDQLNGHQVGNLYRSAQRLAKIKVYQSSNLIRIYQLDYTLSALTGRSLINKISLCVDDLNCLPGINITWENADLLETGFEPYSQWLGEDPASYSANYPRGVNAYGDTATFVDMDGDGLPDRIRAAQNGQSGLWVAINTGSGFEPFNRWLDAEGTNFSATYPRGTNEYGDHSVFLDMNNDGLPDRVRAAQNGQLGIWIALNNGSGYEPYSQWLGEDPANYSANYPRGVNAYGDTATFVDMDGDGLPDRVRAAQNGQIGLWVAINTGSGFEPFSRWLDAEGTNFSVTYPRGTNEYGDHSVFLDMNNDGLPDRVRAAQNGQLGIWIALNNGSGYEPYSQWLGEDPANYSANYPRGVNTYGDTAAFVDVNGDGLPDRIRAAQNGQIGLWVAINTGSGFEPFSRWLDAEGTNFSVTYPRGTNEYGDHSVFLDMNNDGLPDRVRAAQNGQLGIWVALNSGSGYEPYSQWLGEDPANYSANYPRGVNAYGDTAAFVDMNGDGLPDRVRAAQNGALGVWVALNVNSKIRLSKITNGLGLETSITYSTLSDPNVFTKSSGAIYPEADLANAIDVVGHYETYDDVGNSAAYSFHYEGLLGHRQGRGALGFASIETTNEQTGIVTRVEYNQSFPYTGTVVKAEQLMPDGTVVSQSETTYSDQESYGGSVHAIHATQSIKRSFKRDGSLVSTVTTEQSSIDQHGNVGHIQVITDGGGETYTKITDNAYDNDTTNWYLGRLTRSTVTHQHQNGTVEIRSSSFGYDPITGLLDSEAIEPDDPNLWQTSTTQYDGFGNKTAVTVTGADFSPRTTTTQYDSEGRFPAWTENVLGHRETYVYDPACGKPTSLTGPNNLTTTWAYDSLCRKVREDRADGTSTTWYYAWADGEAPNARYKLITTASGKPPTIVYYDKLSRVVRKENIGFDGTPIYQDNEYDALGRVSRKSLPYFQGETAYWVSTEYDDLSRPVTIHQPVTGGGTAQTHFGYDGLTSSETDALGRIKTTIKNNQGKTIRIEQEEGAWLEHEYDAVGNLIRTNANSIITTMSYDIRGRKTGMDDPNMGHWDYRYNALGELIWQKDAEQQEVNLTYDALGRMIQRVELEGITTWVFDTATNGIGKLTEAQAAMGYRKVYGYDDLGRPSVTTTHADNQSFSISTEYDALGRVQKTTRPQGFELENQYNAQGFLKAIRTLRSQISDYDASHLRFLLDTALNDAQTALDNALEVADSAYYYEQKASEYRQLSGDPSLDPELQAQLEASATELDLAADLLITQFNSYIELADRLLDTAEQLFAREQTLLQRYVFSGSNDNTSLYQEMVNDDQHVYFWQAKRRDASGRLTGELVGNGLATGRYYNPGTGQLALITSGFGYANPIRNLEYQYDALNNVTSRQDLIQELNESFIYDRLDRLTQSHVSGNIGSTPYNHTVDYAYDVYGNILNKSDVGIYNYGDNNRTVGNAGPHALTDAGSSHSGYQYDNNGNMVSGGGRNIDWTSFNKPKRFQKDDKTTEFIYGPDRARYLKVTDSSRTLYIGKAYERIAEAGKVKHKHFIYAGGQLVAIHVKTEESGQSMPDETRYLHRDALGSIDTITDGQGKIVERMSFAPFGQRRAGDWRADGEIILPALTNRGFTGHEHVDEMGLIHMNGRVYDPELGRFLSADPYIQQPMNSQSYNRYSYVLNNPLKYSDPSGYSPLNVLLGIPSSLQDLHYIASNILKYSGDPGYHIAHSKPVKKLFLNNQWARTIGSVVAQYYGGPFGAAAFSAYLVEIQGGTIDDMFKAAMINLMVSYTASGGKLNLSSAYNRGYGDLGPRIVQRFMSQAKNKFVKRLISKYTGFTGDEVNMLLFGVSFGSHAIFSGERMKGSYDGFVINAKGFNNGINVAIDAIDSILAWQGLPTGNTFTIARAYRLGFKSRFHSLASMEGNNLIAAGGISPADAQLDGVPFAVFGLAHEVNINSDDIINFYSHGVLNGFNVNTVGWGGHSAINGYGWRR